ncbi:MAG: TOBE domain-containing protein, partial [Solimonas sp.]
RMKMQLDGGSETVELAAIDEVSAGARVVAMVRPECVRLGAADAGSTDVSLPGKIADTLFAGEKVNVYVQTVVGTVVASLLGPRRQDDKLLAVGTQATVSWHRNDFLVFPQR